MDYVKVIESLLQKTVTKGCTQAEQDSSFEKARGLAHSKGINLFEIKARVESPNYGCSPKVLARRETLKKDKKAAKKETGAHQGFNPFGTYGKRGVQQFIEEKLKDERGWSYDSIATMSKTKFGGKTSTKSVASVACRLKKLGIVLPKRARSV